MALLLAGFGSVGSLSYELILVQDGGEEASFAGYSDLPLVLLRHRERCGPGAARNTGASRARGKYLVFLDADTSPAPGYFAVLERTIAGGCVFGGGAEALPSGSSSRQRAMHYVMSSWLTTGGIRGKGNVMERFKPRTHNMFILRRCFDQLGGFSTMRYGEDMDFSLRAERAGIVGVLVRDLLVYHWRKPTMGLFFQQTHHSGAARVGLTRLHPGSLRLVHMLPVAFVLCCVLALGLPWMRFVLAGYLGLVWAGASRAYGARTGAWAVVAVFAQLFGYASGFIKASLRG